jgi:peroxiredoxin
MHVSYLAVAVIIFGALSLLNLWLTFALIHRFARQSKQLAGMTRLRPTPRLAPGGKAPEFAAATTVGEKKTLADLTGASSLLGFFSVQCPPCKAAVPEFKQYASSIPGGASQVLAVISGDAGETTAALVRDLADSASVIVEPQQGPVASAFSVLGYPTFYVLDENGRIESSGATVRQLASADLV